MKVLFISDGMSLTNTGIASVSTRNYNLVKSAVGDQNVDLVVIGNKQSEQFKGAIKTYNSPSNKLCSLINCLNLYYPVLNGNIVSDIKKTIRQHSYDVIYIDNSMYGKLAKKIKKEFINIKVVIFYHDIKYQLAKQDLKNSGFIYYPKYIATIYNERLSSIYSDKIITINERDAAQLNKIYNKQSDLNLPVTMKDRFNVEIANKNNNNKKVPTALFVGVGDYFPNVNAMNWFISKVLSQLDLELIVIGKNMEKHKEKFEGMSSKVKVEGTVVDIDSYYYKCDFVIAPLFDGAGMKVKVAEAFMFGKTVFGTKEAFEGYDIDKYSGSGFLCNNPIDYIKAIKNYIENNKDHNYNDVARKLYLENFIDKLYINKLVELLK
ncbi:glycosyltransferase [Clostridium tagluense]|uniref:glycosyltransferase n=1 Tax=Clostridium tagluense TaxID=360422 RepID=UPI001C6E01EF|nr:glycosyltransferase [Clostridium tagluense]MBW9155651.1 glycosyltransferase [Clostridium tagluense]WLC65254.1 glycosyltransferase [Clostridium tagluense]